MTISLDALKICRKVNIFPKKKNYIYTTARNRGSSQKGYILKTTNEFTLSVERLKDLPLISEIRIRCLLLPFNIALNILTRAIKTRKISEKHPNWKHRSKAIFVHR